MLALLTLVVLFVVLLLAVVWSPFLVQKRPRQLADNSFRDQTNIDLYHEHKAEIENDFRHGDIDQQNYDYLLAELNQSLLQDIDENSAEAEQQRQAHKVKETRLAIAWPMVLSTFILVFSGYFYSQYGAYDVLVNNPVIQADTAENSADQQAQLQVKQLIKLTQDEPNNAEAWYRLGLGFVTIGQFDRALSAYDQVIAIDGEKADLFGAKAQAVYYRDGQVISPLVQQYINKALAIDNRDPATHILLGMHNFINKAYQQAIDYWQVVVSDARPNVNIQVLKEAIVQAKNNLLPNNAPNNVPEDSSATGPKLALNVSIGEAIVAQLAEGEDKIVFIYAIPTNGARMPVAAVKVKASDLPLALEFSDQSAMTPQMKLSDVDKVNLLAVISATGEVGMQPGDFKGQINDVLVIETGVIELVIDTVIE